MDKAPAPSAPAPPATPVAAAAVSALATGVATKISAIRAFFSVNWQTIVVALLFTIVLSFGVALVIYNIVKRNNTQKKMGYLIEATSNPIKGTQVSKVTAKSGMPANTKEGAFSFWVYMQSFDKYAGTYGHILHRGTDDVSTPEMFGPSVYVSPTSNKFHVYFRSNKPIPSDITFSTPEQKLEYLYSTQGITIDYIPSNRWVHVVVTVNTRKQTLTAYLDGELVKTVNATSQMYKVGDKIVGSRFDSLDILGSGDFYIGGSQTSAVGAGFYGLLVSLKFFDYALSSGEVFKEYRKGPLSTMLGSLGLPAYGVRTPIYRLSENFSTE